MTRKTDAAPGGVEVRPTGKAGSFVIDPATGLPMVPVAPEPETTATAVKTATAVQSKEAGK